MKTLPANITAHAAALLDQVDETDDVDALEVDIQNSILGTFGCLPGVWMHRNAIDHRGAARFGLGAGSPDLIAMVHPFARLIGLEVKRPGRYATKLQRNVHAQWRARGAYVTVVRSVADAWVALGKATEMSASKDAWADWGDVLPPPANGFVVFDTETTGKSNSDRICEIAAVRVVDGKIVDRFEQLACPEMDIPRDATAIHGIHNYEVRNAPLVGEVLQAFKQFVGLFPLMAHNAAFDVRMLRNESERTNVQLPFVPVYCSWKIAKAVLPKSKMKVSHALSALIERYRVERVRAHRAMPDVLGLVGVLRGLARDLARERPGVSLRDVHGPAQVLCDLGVEGESKAAETDAPKSTLTIDGVSWAS